MAKELHTLSHATEPLRHFYFWLKPEAGTICWSRESSKQNAKEGCVLEIHEGPSNAVKQAPGYSPSDLHRYVFWVLTDVGLLDLMAYNEEAYITWLREIEKLAQKNGLMVRRKRAVSSHSLSEGEGISVSRPMSATGGESPRHNATQSESHRHNATQGESRKHSATGGESHRHSATLGESHRHSATQGESPRHNATGSGWTDGAVILHKQAASTSLSGDQARCERIPIVDQSSHKTFKDFFSKRTLVQPLTSTPRDSMSSDTISTSRAQANSLMNNSLERNPSSDDII